MNSDFFVHPIAIMIDTRKEINRLKNPVYIYGFLVFIMLLCKIFLRDWWSADQYIIYNLLSFFILSFFINTSVQKNKSIVKFIPVFILFCFFFNPVLLKKIFLLSHILILFLLIKSKKLLWEPGAALIPIELIVIIIFL